MKYVFILLAAATLFCCSKKEKNCVKDVVATITSVTMPDTVPLNSQVDMNLEYLLSQDCGHTDAVEIDTTASTINVTVLTTQTGCECKQLAGYIPIKHTLTAHQVGTFYFRFESGNGYYLHTLVVQ